jgi:hypothetical protein
VTGSGADLAQVQYRPSAYSNPMRVILRGPLGYRTSATVKLSANGSSTGRLMLQTRVTLAVDRFVYAPCAAAVAFVASGARALQSGRLSIYMLYMLAALVIALSLVPILR